MSALKKLAILAGGYAGAWGIAVAAVAARAATQDQADRNASSGMYAFGDMLWFLAVFGVTAIPATGASFYFLRPYPGFWRKFSIGALAVAATAVAAAAGYILAKPGAPSWVESWGMWSVLRLILSPLGVILFGLGAIFAPNRFARLALFSASAGEGVSFALGLISLLGRGP